MIALVALWLAGVLLAAKIAGDIAVRLRQPPVLGELLAGVIIGNLPFIPAPPQSLTLLAELGVLLLLFEVGLSSTVAEMMRVGATALLVATLGVVAPFALGYGASAALLPALTPLHHAFVGATLTATSVGITARVLHDLGVSRTPTARIILGAAVIDDILGLTVLASIVALVESSNGGEPAGYGGIAIICAKAALFLIGALAVGTAIAPHLMRGAARLKSSSVLLAVGLSFCFFLAWGANAVGLAPIVGAYAAGLLLEKPHASAFIARGEKPLDDLIAPIVSFLVPIFFVTMGMHVSLRSLTDPNVVALAVVLTAVGVVGKLVCGLVAGGRATDRLAVGIGMMPRGEVGLIFANVGLGLTVGGVPLVSESTYSAIVIVVIVTTFATPPLLKKRFSPRNA